MGWAIGMSGCAYVCDVSLVESVVSHVDGHLCLFVATDVALFPFPPAAYFETHSGIELSIVHLCDTQALLMCLLIARLSRWSRCAGVTSAATTVLQGEVPSTLGDTIPPQLCGHQG